jgi:hypothetical protein
MLRNCQLNEFLKTDQNLYNHNNIVKEAIQNIKYHVLIIRLAQC